MAPELLDYKSHSDYDAFKSDVYSLAIILFLFLFNEFPERSLTTRGSIDASFDRPIILPMNEIPVSDSARQLIRDMSCADSRKRFNIIQIMDSEWMTKK